MARIDDEIADGGTVAPGISPGLIAALRDRLLGAWDVGKRDLPWRGETDPYRILVSEVMLQQTRVETVIPYYKKWMERFPGVEALARAEEEEVLGVWEGLGYYSRARRLLEAARVVRERYGGALPTSLEELRSLPGVGAYTAGAVASIAFGEVVEAVDGNVTRVLSRVFDLPDPAPARIGFLARSLVDPERPGDFNQALMDLGATVCVPRAPGCSACPLGELCLARERGTAEERPGRRRGRPVPEITIAVGVAARLRREAEQGRAAADGRGPYESGELELLLRRRPATGLLAGMWELPGEETAPEDEGAHAARRALAGLARDEESPPLPLTEVLHTFSHLKVRYRPFLFLTDGEDAPEGTRWVREGGLRKLPVPVAQRRIIALALDAVRTL